jgi:hypothetical protein
LLAWARDALAACDIPDAAVQCALSATKDSRPEDWETVGRGHAGGRDLPWRARLRLAHFLMRGVRSLLRG